MAARTDFSAFCTREPVSASSFANFGSCDGLQGAANGHGLRKSSAQALKMSAKCRSLPPIETATSLTFARRATVANWSAWGGSFLYHCPPSTLRSTSVVVAPEHARLKRSCTVRRAFRISATSERSQPLR